MGADSYKKKLITGLIVGTIGALAGLICLTFLYRILMHLPLAARMPWGIVSYWIIAAAPVAVMLYCNDKPRDYGFTKQNITGQILTGLVIGVLMSVVLTLLPHLAGLGDFVDNGRRYIYLWQFAYEFVYCVFAVGFVEELVFRGFIYRKTELLCGSEAAAVAVSSAAFGLFHFLGGSIIQMIVTGLLGVFWCVCRNRIKSCTIISLIIAHGVYDALISVWAAVFFNGF